MKVGTQHGDSEEILRACEVFGVHNIYSGLPSRRMDEAWSVESLTRLRDRVASYGITLDMVPLPMSSEDSGRRPSHREGCDEAVVASANCAEQFQDRPGRLALLFSRRVLDVFAQHKVRAIVERGPHPTNIHPGMQIPVLALELWAGRGEFAGGDRRRFEEIQLRFAAETLQKSGSTALVSLRLRRASSTDSGFRVKASRPALRASVAARRFIAGRWASRACAARAMVSACVNAFHMPCSAFFSRET